MFPTALMLRYTHTALGRAAAGTEPIIILLYCVAACGIAPLCGMRGICLLPAGALRPAGAVLRACCGRIRLSLCFRRFDYGVERHSKAFVSTSDSRRFPSPAPPQPARSDAETVGIPHVAEPAGGGAGRFMGRGRTFVWFPMKKNMRFFCLNSKFIIFAYVKL